MTSLQMSPLKPASVDEDSESERMYFCSQCNEVEDLENYIEGGFHPVLLDDTFDHGRYHIIHKLGHGGFSTVWLARDTVDGKYVALKIIEARPSDSSRELAILLEVQELRRTSSDHPGSVCIEPLLRHFRFRGPNGNHLCLVLPVLGPPLSHLSGSMSGEEKTRAMPDAAKKLCFQITQAVAYLHAHGICHGDLTARNVLLHPNPGFDLLDKESIFELLGHPIRDTVELLSRGAPGVEAPAYVVDTPHFPVTSDILSGKISIIDFDQSFHIQDPPKTMLGTPPKYLAPEAILDLNAGPASEVWALGCLIFRVRTGFDVFDDGDVMCSGSPSGALMQMVRVLGAPPQSWLEVAFDEEVADSEIEILEIPEMNSVAKVEEIEEIKVVTKLTMPSRKLKIKISNELLVELEKMQINFKLN